MTSTTCRSRIHDVLTTPIEFRMVFRTSFVECLAAVSVVLVLTHLIVPQVQAAREAARRTTCKSGLKNLGLALHNYFEMYGDLPAPRGVPNGSPQGDQVKNWPDLILPQLATPPRLDSFIFVQPDPTDQFEFRLISKWSLLSNDRAEPDGEYIF